MKNSHSIPAVEKVSATDNVAYVTISHLPCDKGVLSKLFGEIAEKGIKLDLITQITEYTNTMSVSFSLNDEDFLKLSPILKSLKGSYADIEIAASAGNTKISIYGQNINEYSGVAKAVFEIFDQCNIDIKVISTSELDISILIDEIYEDEIINRLKATFKL
jgi:aspartokinase